MKYIEARAFAKPRREKRLRSLTEAHHFKMADKFVASLGSGREIPGWCRRAPGADRGTCPVERLDGGPFVVGEFVAYDSEVPVWELEVMCWAAPSIGKVRRAKSQYADSTSAFRT
jgi:hypothetical protein